MIKDLYDVRDQFAHKLWLVYNFHDYGGQIFLLIMEGTCSFVSMFPL